MALLLALALPTAIIDPYFHYHAPLDGLSYWLHNERYQNDGIVRNFECDAIISGTSLCENFKTSEFDSLFGVTSVKAPFSGASFREIADNLDRAFAAHDDLRYIIRSLDYDYLLRAADYYHYEGLPDYLYDDNLLNDTSYLLNFEILVDETAKVLRRTGEGKPMTTFDYYASWDTSAGTTPDEYFDWRQEHETANLYDGEGLTEENREKIRENVAVNVARQAEENPDTQFYLFFPPCSIYFWDREIQRGDALELLDAITLAVEELIGYDNVHLFLFTDREETICDIGDYSELLHYSADTNSRILEWMRDGEDELTEENYRQACAAMYEFFDTYDFDALFAGE